VKKKRYRKKEKKEFEKGANFNTFFYTQETPRNVYVGVWKDLEKNKCPSQFSRSFFFNPSGLG
jgi:hypothetical protein